MACSAAGCDADDVAGLRVKIQQQRKQISRLTLALEEQKARVDAIQAVNEMRANVAATRQAIVTGAGAKNGNVRR